MSRRTPASPRTLLVSVHDVTPGTLPRVREIVRALRPRIGPALTLLVVPGWSWAAPQIRQLRAWQDGGIELAGHGWRHRAERICTLGHRVHSRVISRDEAEHLSLSREGICARINRCHAWFAGNGLRPPSLYVPPAWAMGRLPPAASRALPFSFYETLCGVYDARTGDFLRMPVTGYMADTPSRVVLLKGINALCLALPLRAVRIALHPNDLRLPLRRDVFRHLSGFRRFSTCTAFLGRAGDTRLEGSRRNRAGP